VKNLVLSRYALSCCVAAAMLAGCGGSQPPIGASGAMPQTSVSAAHVERDGSWMLPEATSDDLLYVTNYSYVSVYSYPEGKLVGTLKSFYSSVGECVDAKGDVFVTDDSPSKVYEYAHGGTKRIASFPTGRAGARGCAISPTTGDLAISGFSNYVEIYRGATGKGIARRDKEMSYGGFDTYDEKGNLFFLGLKNSKGRQQLSELPNGSTEFRSIRLDANTYDLGGIQWNNGYLTTVSDTRQTGLYQFQITGTKGHKVSSTTLGQPAYIVLQYFIDGKTVVVPNLGNPGTNVLYYKYPAGGKPGFILTKDVTDARGVVVSRDT